MRASPYELSELGYQPVPIETAAGKAEYVAAQRTFAQSAQLLRHRLLDVVNRVDGAGSAIEIGSAATEFQEQGPADHDQRADQADDGGDAIGTGSGQLRP